MSRAAIALTACAMMMSAGSRAGTSDRTDRADNPAYDTKDPHETVITDISGWSHPTKQVFTRYGMKLTKVELMWNKTFPVFHVADFGADPGAGPNGKLFARLDLDLLKANGYHPFRIVEDHGRDGFVVVYDKQTRTLSQAMVQDESP